MTDQLNLDAAGLSADKRGRIKVNEFFQTEVPHIYAVGDVIGFPALAATSMEQGRLAAHHACGEPVPTAHTIQPIGRRRVQLPDAGRVLQGRRAGRHQQNARDHPAVQR
jgi:pyruvate/2-oxoglutarate dehydrogenase complex dihydrolipoamide dehydrogenase (E3) component